MHTKAGKYPKVILGVRVMFVIGVVATFNLFVMLMPWVANGLYTSLPPSARFSLWLGTAIIAYHWGSGDKKNRF